jgi:ubiquinone/menaquinone biosynthesis C-methylase UbiE
MGFLHDRRSFEFLEKLNPLLKKMEADWDKRARQNAEYYIATLHEEWSKEEFLQSGRVTVEQQILTDMTNICQGKDPRRMKVLEIGCGIGRMTLALAEVFGEVYGVDVSGEMIRKAQALAEYAGIKNVHFYKNNGMDLRVLPRVKFDFAFSYIVFQHIPSKEIIVNYLREVHRRLAPGALFKFQVQGCQDVESWPEDTWLGVPITEEEAVEMARSTGFDPRFRVGAGEQYFWLWFFKQPEQGVFSKVLSRLVGQRG